MPSHKDSRVASRPNSMLRGHGYGMRHVDNVPVTDWTLAAEPWLKSVTAVKDTEPAKKN